MQTQRAIQVLTAGAVLAASTVAGAADWSDTSLGIRYGNKFAEPFGRNDISKTIYSLTHVSGYKYGTNFFNVDFLQSDNKDPQSAASNAGAQEAYMVYRHTFDIGKISGKDLKWGVIRGWGATLGFDWNANANNKVSLRYIQLDSKSDQPISNSSSLGFGNRRDNANSMSFANSGYAIKENIRSIVGEINSQLGANKSNNFIIGYSTNDESREYKGDIFPTVDILKELPRNPTGKVLKRDLRKPYWEGRDRQVV